MQNKTQKFVIYTSLTGGYDKLPYYGHIDDRFDYICFSNDYPDGSKVGIWTIRRIPIDNLSDNTRLSRYAKLLPHEVLKDYEYSLWLDSNISIEKPEFYEIVVNKIQEGNLWYGIQHPLRDCIYDDAEACVRAGVAKFREIHKQMNFLRKEGFPKHYGLFENNVILRKHNDSSITSMDTEWWHTFLRFSKRDQMSLFYIFWKHNFKPDLLLKEQETTRNVMYLTYKSHHKNIRSRIFQKIRIYKATVCLHYFNI